VAVTRRFVLTRGLALTAASTTAAVSAPGMIPHYTPVDSPALAAADRPAPAPRPVARAPADPLTLGVASGDPAPDGFVLWTRLAPVPLARDGRGGMPARDVEVEWQVADDAAFRHVVRAGTAPAQRAWGHSVHVEVGGLPAGREFFYRFRAGGHLSPTGRTRTAPAPSSAAPVRYALAACANYEHGWFTAYRHLAEAAPDLVFFLGDYTYEGAPGTHVAASGNVRRHVGGRTTSLAEYRQRHAQYKTDRDLQAAHAAAPWAVTYDDHEVLNNWAGDLAAREDDQARFARIRAAAVRAWYENMPVRRAARPDGGRLQAYRRLPWGRVATFHVLDTRRHRTDQPCGDGIEPRCADRFAAGRTLLGGRQERWLADGLRESAATWDVLAQQVMFSQNWLSGFRWDPDDDGRTGFNMDCWDGYPAARERLLATARRARVDNLVVLTGDWHTHWAAELLPSYRDPGARPVGVELITSSISSDGDGEPQPQWGLDSLAEQPWFRHFDQRRGFVLVTADTDRMRADFRVVDHVSRRGAPVRSSAAYVVEAGRARLETD
jgi:alkaline phosphatase D